MPLTTITTMLSHPLIRGDPYNVYRRQLKSAIVYGKPEKLSVVLFSITLLNVVLFTNITKYEINVIHNMLPYSHWNENDYTHIGAPYMSKAKALPVMSCRVRKIR